MLAKLKEAPPKEKVWNWGRLGMVAASLLVIAALGFVSYHIGDNVSVTTDTPPKPVPSAAPTTPPAPALTSLPAQISAAPLKDARGPSFKLADFSGKVVLVNLWATWCGPCRLETPELVKLHKEFHSRGVELIGLSIENPDASAEKVHKFIQDFQVDYRIGWAPGQVAAALMQGRDSIPQSFVISRNGRVLKRFVGFSPANTPAQLKQALEEALKDKS
jgi:peroxiredoxin